MWGGVSSPRDALAPRDLDHPPLGRLLGPHPVGPGGRGAHRCGPRPLVGAAPWDGDASSSRDRGPHGMGARRTHRAAAVRQSGRLGAPRRRRGGPLGTWRGLAYSGGRGGGASGGGGPSRHAALAGPYDGVPGDRGAPALGGRSGRDRRAGGTTLRLERSLGGAARFVAGLGGGDRHPLLCGAVRRASRWGPPRGGDHPPARGRPRPRAESSTRSHADLGGRRG